MACPMLADAGGAGGIDVQVFVARAIHPPTWKIFTRQDLPTGTFCVGILFVFFTHPMSTRFTVSEKAVADRDGSGYSIENYTEGTDYVQRKCFKSMKRVFRSDILGVSVVDPSKVEHKQEPKVALELDEKGLRIVFAEPTPEDWRPSAPECKKIEQSQVSGTSRDQVQECKVTRIYPNFKWVDTTLGRIWAGLKGRNLRLGQIIRVKNGELFLGKFGPSGGLVRI